MSSGGRAVNKVIAASRRSRKADCEAGMGPLPRHPYRGGPEVAIVPPLRSAAFQRASWGRWWKRALFPRGRGKVGLWRQWAVEQGGPEIMPRLCVAVLLSWLWTSGWILAGWLIVSLVVAALECRWRLRLRVLPRLRRLRGTGCT